MYQILGTTKPPEEDSLLFLCRVVRMEADYLNLFRDWAGSRLDWNFGKPFSTSDSTLVLKCRHLGFQQPFGWDRVWGIDWAHPKVSLELYPCLLSTPRLTQTPSGSLEPVCLAPWLWSAWKFGKCLKGRMLVYILPLLRDTQPSIFYFSFLHSEEVSLPFSRGPLPKYFPWILRLFDPHPEWVIAQKENAATHTFLSWAHFPLKFSLL